MCMHTINSATSPQTKTVIWTIQAIEQAREWQERDLTMRSHLTGFADERTQNIRSLKRKNTGGSLRSIAVSIEPESNCNELLEYTAKSLRHGNRASERGPRNGPQLSWLLPFSSYDFMAGRQA
ncbi:hypothetical protein AcV7_004376 [Taiwanofungus camphoratus]|nr:hypothetical protein AcV7_004376 [Antrodia cinnamomea]